jgi:hypothetical protein
MNAIYLEPAMVPAALRGTYSGKKFKAVVVTSVTIPADAGLWSDGSRDRYHGVAIETGAAMAFPGQAASPWDHRQDCTVTLEPGFAIVRHSVMCGADYGLTFYVHPDNAAKLLPAPAPELTDFERIVLEATRSLKSSYNGRDRYQMACVDCLPYGAVPKMTRTEYSAAKETLRQKGLLNKAGAITPAGRNAV